jgi:hypothetical protein
MHANDIVAEFGEGGNAGELIREGWSNPEPGFCWTVGLESTLSLPSPPIAARYTLFLTVRPHVRPEILPKQALIVAVNDVIVGVSELVENTEISCEVPRYALDMAKDLIVRLIHPHASAPSVVADIPDDRELAIAVEKIRLRCHETSEAEEPHDTSPAPSDGGSAVSRRTRPPPVNVARRY